MNPARWLIINSDWPCLPVTLKWCRTPLTSWPRVKWLLCSYLWDLVFRWAINQLKNTGQRRQLSICHLLLDGWIRTCNRDKGFDGKWEDDAREGRLKGSLGEDKEGRREGRCVWHWEKQSAFAQFIDQEEQPWPTWHAFHRSAAVQAALAA